MSTLQAEMLRLQQQQQFQRSQQQNKRNKQNQNIIPTKTKSKTKTNALLNPSTSKNKHSQGIIIKNEQDFVKKTDFVIQNFSKDYTINEPVSVSSPGLTSVDKIISTNERLRHIIQFGTIFISIASYRDPECCQTVQDIFRKAKYPNRIYIGVCQQNDASDNTTDSNLSKPQVPDCLSTVTAIKFKDQIRVINLNSDDARGPTYARSLIETELFKDETFYLQIDSHMIFIPNFDVELIQELLSCPSAKPILSTYPDDYDPNNRTNLKVTSNPSYLRFRNFHATKEILQQEKIQFKQIPKIPIRTLFWAAGFSMSMGSSIREVPYNPNTAFLFLGEEISMAARYFTCGYDIFTPSRHFVFHLSSRTNRNLFWELFYENKSKEPDPNIRRARKQMELNSEEMVRSLLEDRYVQETEDKKWYGLGNVKKLSDFETEIGINFKTKEVKKHAKLGFTLKPSNEERRVKHQQ